MKTNKCTAIKKSRVVDEVATPLSEWSKNKSGTSRSSDKSKVESSSVNQPFTKQIVWQESSWMTSASCCCMAAIQSSWLNLGGLHLNPLPLLKNYHRHVYYTFWGSAQLQETMIGDFFLYNGSHSYSETPLERGKYIVSLIILRYMLSNVCVCVFYHKSTISINCWKFNKK